MRNKNEDFYELIDNDQVPDFDVLVTNPPYSADHVERLLRFCFLSDKFCRCCRQSTCTASQLQHAPQPPNRTCTAPDQRYTISACRGYMGEKEDSAVCDSVVLPAKPATTFELDLVIRKVHDEAKRNKRKCYAKTAFSELPAWLLSDTG